MCSHYVIFEPLLSKGEQTCHTLTQATSLEQLSQGSRAHVLKSGSWVVPEHIDADKASALCYRVHTATRWWPLQTRGILEVHRKSGMIYSQQMQQVRDTSFGPQCTVSVIGEVLSTRCRSPLRILPLCRKPDSIRYTQRQELSNSSWLTHGLYKTYL